MPEFDSTIKYAEIPGYPGYKAGSDGTIWSCRRSKQLRQKCPGKFSTSDQWRKMSLFPAPRGGYIRASLVRGDGKLKNLQVHTFILWAFVGPRPNNQSQTRHLDGNPANNSLENLKWGTPSENYKDRVRHGRANRGLGERCVLCKLNDAKVRELYQFAKDNPHLSLSEIGAEYGVVSKTVNNILSRRSWTHLDLGEKAK